MIYSIAAIFLLGISFLNVNRKVHGTQERMMFSELALEMTSVGAELLDEIGKYPFDNGTLAGLTVETGDLSDPDLWDASACDPDDSDFDGCSTISDFDGKTAERSETRVHGGTPYTVPYNITAIDVAFVTEAAPHGPSGTATFAKEVTLTVSTPALVDGDGDPIEIEMSRVYMYPDL